MKICPVCRGSGTKGFNLGPMGKTEQMCKICSGTGKLQEQEITGYESDTPSDFWRNPFTENVNPFSRQVGGSHYKDYEIEPYEFLFRNKIPHHKASIIRRILRYDHPTGHGKKDLDKIRHELDLIEHLDEDLKGE